MRRNLQEKAGIIAEEKGMWSRTGQRPGKHKQKHDKVARGTVKLGKTSGIDAKTKQKAQWNERKKRNAAQIKLSALRKKRMTTCKAKTIKQGQAKSNKKQDSISKEAREIQSQKRAQSRQERTWTRGKCEKESKRGKRH